MSSVEDGEAADCHAAGLRLRVRAIWPPKACAGKWVCGLLKQGQGSWDALMGILIGVAVAATAFVWRVCFGVWVLAYGGSAADERLSE